MDYVAIATLNDFIFCPYSIYLHSVYMESDEDIYKATPQIAGNIVHTSVNQKTATTRKADIMSLPVYSDIIGISGVIDIYKENTHLLVERKNHLKHIYTGQLYQLWAQYFCMLEMGYVVEKLAFYEVSTNKMINIELPNEQNKNELIDFVQKFKIYKPDADLIEINPNKCSHCIYCNLCDKTDSDNVYT